MIEILPESHDNVLAVRGCGKLTDEDYKEVLIPRLDTLSKEYPKLGFLFEMDDDFEGWDFDAALTYAKFGFKHRDDFDRVAAVCGPTWVNLGMKLQSLFTNADVETFSCGERSDALKWIEGEPTESGSGPEPGQDQCC